MTGQGVTGREVLCPVCLRPLLWTELTPLRYDSESLRYVEVEIAPGASDHRRRLAERGAVVRCPEPAGEVDEHYLPIDYGRHLDPVVLGLVGATSSGKTHLLAALIGAIEAGELSKLGISCRPLDQAWHRRFMEENVRPLLHEQRVLNPTREGHTHFADAFLMRQEGSAGDQERTVAIFDVAGAELGSELTSIRGAKPFLEIASGLIFVIDPTRFELTGPTGEDTFNTVLTVLGQAGRLRQTSAAIVLNKADLLRFDDPVTRWLRTEVGTADPERVFEESADVFAYLHASNAESLARPVRECGKATLHVVTATGGPDLGKDIYPRGVRPRRVLAPLIALLAMTGVLAGSRAERIGTRG
ncbi:MAG TPA: GTPase domain-containing protein [Streptosporangiaceae bacterium]|nr:GTPase domain-containing protein [Streptosporangiaceae bacterium]